MTFESVESSADACIAAGGERRGFLFARFGHCESRIMGWRTTSTRSDADASLRLQLGTDQLSDADLDEMSSKIRDSYRESDYVGLAMISEGRHKSADYLDKLNINIPTIAEIYSLNRAQRFCDANAHTALLATGQLKRIVSCFEKVVLISCRDVSYGFAERHGIVPIQIFVPQEHRTVGLAEEFVLASHYPDHFHQVLSKIERFVSAGTLVLFGAGFLGKVYGAHAKRQGGVVVDIGSVFDIWAGIKSRGHISEDDLQAYRLTKAGVQVTQEFIPTSASRKDWVVDVSDWSPKWDTSRPAIRINPPNEPRRASFTEAEIFIHSSMEWSNFVEVNPPGAPCIKAIAATLVVSHIKASTTVFRMIVTDINGKSYHFFKSCAPDSSFMWLQGLPDNTQVTSLSISTRPVDGGGQAYGWCFIRGLTLY